MKIKKYRGVWYSIQKYKGQMGHDYSGFVYWKGKKHSIGNSHLKRETVAVAKSAIDALVDEKGELV